MELYPTVEIVYVPRTSAGTLLGPRRTRPRIGTQIADTTIVSYETTYRLTDDTLPAVERSIRFRLGFK